MYTYAFAESGRLKLAALTNNHVVPEDHEDYAAMSGPSPKNLLPYFDVFLESSVIGLR
jgi:hypothetical protein